MDSFISKPKARYRRDCLEYLQENAAKSLFDSEKRLKGKWCELVGGSGHLTLELLLSVKVLSPSGFIGVDSNKVHIATHQARYPEATWLHGNLQDVIHELEGVSVLNVDSYSSTGYRTTRELLKSLEDVARASIQRRGAFGLFLNPTLGGAKRHGLTTRQALLNLTQDVSAILTGWCPESRFTPESFWTPPSLLV